MDSGSAEPLYGIWGSSATDVCAVGAAWDKTAIPSKGIILHYDGTSWSAESAKS